MINRGVSSQYLLASPWACYHTAHGTPRSGAQRPAPGRCVSSGGGRRYWVGKVLNL